MYKIILPARFERMIKKIPKSDIKKIVDAIDRLATDPRPHGYIQLKGKTDAYRIRVGNFRIIYRVNDNLITVFILKIGDRKNIYLDI